MSFRVELPGAAVLFSTREGGFSKGAFESLNLGLLTGDDRETVIRNRRRLADQGAVAPENVAMGWQVHGTDIREWEGPDPDTAFLDPQGGHLKVDGHITRNSELGLLVLVADCLPVAIAGHGAVAMVHCGWRGLAGGLIGKATEQMGGAVAAAVGPGIGQCCYEVGQELLDAFTDYDDVADGRMLNLRAIADAQLRAAGIEQVEHVDYCTSCHPELFFSHRRDNGVTGRQGGMAWLAG
ncbi:MAG: purine-nucleoside/S-methyl-5-thioadenosine phosphorylase / adenosine deaminase [Thermoleophilaceae bacterium]|nr:purine-nucleoside/S-methyl-5-thioadenosine phosphorylase / adenosine deaminase [Thermoleophilaceae bacterium]